MYKIEKAVKDLMENHMGIYVNLSDVEITTGLDFSVCLAIDFEEESNEDITIGLIYSCDTLDEFISVFKIRTMGQVKAIARKQLMELYHQGKASMYCIIEGYHSFSLYFLKQGDKMIAKDDYDEAHEVSDLLETPQQLMDYTREHFKMPKKPAALQHYQHTHINGKNDKEDLGQVGLTIV